ncbi:RNA transcription, translation and transport factor protein-like [Oppia nitens]|uniref:RNA transcription, translation and transport factor protein-like n=1 Tax=Oppia nitens TaxID=1686743 RepID=UPI0023DA3A10|nr:RNA transcription, translation and transport factor protein-like [Oppia nitens]
MFDRKLQSLDYYSTNEFDINDTKQFRQLMTWLEDQKIRHYKIEDRYRLRDIDGKDWDTMFERYLSDISCPNDILKSKHLILDWILTLAIRLQYEDNLEKYRQLSDNDMKREPQLMQTNPLDRLDFDSNEFKFGISQLAQLLKVPIHPTNHLLTLTAISLVIKNKISMEFKDNNNIGNTNKLNKIEDNSMNLKVGSNDKLLNNCAKLLRLLYINDLKELQTTINEIIASVQSITANPKTDTSLGKVGVK